MSARTRASLLPLYLYRLVPTSLAMTPHPPKVVAHILHFEEEPSAPRARMAGGLGLLLSMRHAHVMPQVVPPLIHLVA